MPNLMRDQIFISYSHKDQPWMDAFLTMLAPAHARGLVHVWTDRDIPVGSRWFDEIRTALARARVGLLLVTPNFLSSPFIQNEELRALLHDAKSGELLLMWVPISASLYEYTDLKDIQAATATEPTLDALDEPQRQRVIKEICRRMLTELGQLPSLTRECRNTLRDEVAAKIGGKYELLDEIGTGSSSIVYRARSVPFDRPVSVKTLVTSSIQKGLEDRFRKSIEMAFRLQSAAYIRLFDHFLEGPPYCIVTEFVEAARLDQYVTSTVASPRVVQAILLDLVEAIAEAHKQGWLHEGLTPTNVYIDASNRPRLSAFRFLPLVAAATPSDAFLVSREMCTYMCPETFEGKPRTPFSDQYTLGLLGYELLSGKRLPPITCPADFLQRPRLFAELAQQGSWATRSPALAGIVSKMLRVDPEQRWSSMLELQALLEELSIANSDLEEMRQKTIASYVQFQMGADVEQKFYGTFYRRLFELLPAIRRHFEGVDMERQHRLLNRAIKILIEYDSSRPETGKEIEKVATSHQKYGLSGSDFGAFQRALLDTLAEVGEKDPDLLEAWKCVITPGLDYMAGLLRIVVSRTDPRKTLPYPML